MYADEIGGEGAHRYVLMCLVALQDPGLTIFPTHRLLHGLDDGAREALRDAIERDWDVEAGRRVGARAARRRDGVGRRLPRRLSPAPAAADAYATRPPSTRRCPASPTPTAGSTPRCSRRCCCVVALGMSEDDISHLRGLGYARSTAEARELVSSRRRADAAFFMGPTPVERVRDVAAAGETMPPKSTYFFPKVLTGALHARSGASLR